MSQRKLPVVMLDMIRGETETKVPYRGGPYANIPGLRAGDQLKVPAIQGRGENGMRVRIPEQWFEVAPASLQSVADGHPGLVLVLLDENGEHAKHTDDQGRTYVPGAHLCPLWREQNGCSLPDFGDENKAEKAPELTPKSRPRKRKKREKPEAHKASAGGK